MTDKQTYCDKMAGIVEKEEAVVARQRHGKHFRGNK
jgi:hypothetical protein